VVCAVDCGVAVNPNIIAMQMESGIGYGLSAALAGAITLKDGAVEQSNFHDYPVVRMNQMPRIETVIVPSQEEADRGRRALDAGDRAGARRRVPCAERQAGAGVTAFRAGNYLRLVRMALRPVHVAVLALFRRRRAHFEHFAAQLDRTCARPPQFLDLCR